jgi:hypothetical protein
MFVLPANPAEKVGFFRLNWHFFASFSQFIVAV